MRCRLKVSALHQIPERPDAVGVASAAVDRKAETIPSYAGVAGNTVSPREAEAVVLIAQTSCQFSESLKVYRSVCCFFERGLPPAEFLWDAAILAKIRVGLSDGPHHGILPHRDTGFA